MIPNIIGYHANEKQKCTDYIERGIFIKSNDTYWLGDGMYFWDNHSNAIYWMNEKIRKSEAVCVSIIKANVIIDKLLDFTDLETLKRFDKLWSYFCEKRNESIKLPLGKKIEMLFDFFEDLENEFNVLRVNADYNKTPDISFLYSGNNKVTHKIKTIYCVRNNDVIKNAVIEDGGLE